MKDYKKMPFNRIKDIASYVERKLKEGHVIIQILVDEDRNNISELISYANDKERKSYYRIYEDDKCKLEDNVILEYLVPYYASEHGASENVGTAEIDIESEHQNVIGFSDFTKEFSDMEKYYSGESFKWDDNETNYHYEFYISKESVDIANFGGPLELEFVEAWMNDNENQDEKEKKEMNGRERGTIKWFNAQKGYGFITDLNRKDLFVHHSNIKMDGFRLLHEGEIVSFEESEPDEHNRVHAVKVKPILTLKMVKEALEKENLYLSKKKDAYGNTVWLVVNENDVIQAGEQGMYLEELAEYAELNVEGLED